MSFKLVKSETKPLTKDFATAFRAYPPSPTERDLIPSRVAHLEHKVAAGLTIPFIWAIAKLGETTYRMNGQHSVDMLSKLNGRFPKGLFCHLDTYEVKSKEDLALLFRQFDDRKSGRSPADVSGAYQGIEDDLRDLPKSSVKIAIEGVAWFERTVEGVSRVVGDDIYTLLAKPTYHSFLQWIAGLLTMKTPELKKVPVLAAMYATYVAHGGDAQSFWSHVASGGDKVSEDPAFVLDQWLQKIKESGGRGRKILPGQFYQGCLYAWRAHREGRAIKDVKFDFRKGFIDAADPAVEEEGEKV